MKKCEIGMRIFWVILAVMLGSPFVALRAAAQTIDTVEPEIITSGVKHYYETKWYSYSYTEEDQITIEGESYAGIVIPIHQKYAGGIMLSFYSRKADEDQGLVAGNTISTTNGTAYVGLFEQDSFLKENFKQASRTNDLFKSYGTEGTRYLVIYNELPSASSTVTTTLKVQIALEYEDVYTLTQDVVSPNYSCDSQRKNNAEVNITTPGYYIFEVSQNVKMTMIQSSSGSGGVSIPARDLLISSKTDHKIMFNLDEAGTYNITLYSTGGVPFDISYRFVGTEESDTFLLSEDPVHFYLVGETGYGFLKYKADKTGMLQIAGLSDQYHYTTISFYQKKVGGGQVGAYNGTLTVGKEVTKASKTFFYVEKGEEYIFSFYAIGNDRYVNADFKIVGFVEAQILGETTRELADTNQTSLDYNVTYYGTVLDGSANSSWIYISEPCVIRFCSYKERSGEGYQLDYYAGTVKKTTSYVQDDNIDVTQTILDGWTPGYLEIGNGAGRGYYTICVTPKSKPDKPSGDDSGNPSGDESGNPSGDDTGKPSGDDSGKPSGDESGNPSGDDSGKPSGDDTGKQPGSNSSKSDSTSYVSNNAKDTTSNTSNNTFKEVVGKIITLKSGIYCVTSVTNKEVTFMAPANATAKSATIPATIKIDGATYKVTAIAAKAFKGKKNITKIIVGKNVKRIGDNAFNGCKKLKTLTFKTTKLTTSTMNKKALKGLTKTTSIKVPKKCLKSYKKLFRKKGLSSKVKVKK